TIDDTIARDQLMDRIYDHFKLTTDDLAANAIEIKRTTFNTDTRTFLNDRWYLTARLSIEVYTEWTDDLGPGSLVTKIPITITLDF
ncbi:MAG TPA: hypothetical protein VKR58_03385, partial [Aquella sp.]|nr:hypothetical protein [Aquella sp.]